MKLLKEQVRAMVSSISSLHTTAKPAVKPELAQISLSMKF